jgi:hypothetical protein
MEIKTRNKLSTPQRMVVLALLARGDGNAKIVAFLRENYGIDTSEGSISQIKKTHADTLALMKQKIQEHELSNVEDLLEKTRTMIGRKLNRAEKDSQTLEDLDYQFHNGEISEKEYKEKRKGLLDLSIGQIINVSKEIHNQVVKSAPPGGIPPGAGTLGLPSGNAALTDAIVAAIKRGDTVELQKLVLNPGGPNA